MVKVIGVRFRKLGKMYYFKPNANKVDIGDTVIVETIRGQEAARVITLYKDVRDSEILNNIKSIVRVADKEDLEQIKTNKELEKEALDVCSKKIRRHKLGMKLVDAYYTFDRSKIVFYFTSEIRVDFRELVKELASVLRARIELRQIGARDETKVFGGLGICGRPICCNLFLEKIHPVSIKMAKEQGMSLNPAKISGVCGRLMCCVKYEHDAYKELLKDVPRVGTPVRTQKGEGVVVDYNIFLKTLTVKLNHDSSMIPIKVNMDEVELLGESVVEEDDSYLEKFKNLE